MKIRPLSDRIVVRRVAKKEVTEGGIIIPDNAREKPVEGVVLAVGPGRTLEDGRLHPVGVKAEETVLFGKYAGTELKVDGEEVLIIREEDVLAVVG